MKKIILSLSIIFCFQMAVSADGNAFMPLNFNDTNYTKPLTNTANTITNDVVPSVNYMAEEAIGNGNIQNAISQLDNAQSDIRNDLLNYKTKYADVDAQYKLIKAERAALKKQLRTIEKRIKELDNAKEKIRKNML